ncbi:hypothetical protein L218DRAFT_174885 [Marasmius fiardii PR-910]|nr:hypothetical protein L218DRAFT_174885 [Marasmius fiardii PR-910]
MSVPTWLSESLIHDPAGSYHHGSILCTWLMLMNLAGSRCRKVHCNVRVVWMLRHASSCIMYQVSAISNLVLQSH